MSLPKDLETRIKKDSRIKVDSDFFLFNAVGYFTSIPAKILFWNRRISTYPREETLESVVDCLESNKEMDVTVRVGHTRIIEDAYRLFRDESLTKRMNLIARLIGLPITILNNITSKIMRIDSYNPFTNTAIIYSDVPAIALHEMGHAKDFSKRKHLFLYSILRIVPPICLYQEAKASKYAHSDLKPEQKYQTGRYLFPAFGTYVGAFFLGYSIIVGLAAGYVAGGIFNNYKNVANQSSTPNATGC